MSSSLLKITQKFILVPFLLLLMSCSTGPSAQEKRNNFDACVIEHKEQNPGRVMIDPVKDVELRQMRAESSCAYHLK
jgi:hypothetical protein